MNQPNTFEHQEIAWKPTPEVIEKSQLNRFMKQLKCSNWEELYRFSIENVERFTEEVLKFLEIQFNPPYKKLLDVSEGIAWSKWCVGGGLNISEMCLDRWLGTEIENNPAVIWEGENAKTETLTYRELMSAVQLTAAGLRAEGFSKGDAIGIHLPMIPSTVIALLAIARIGAIAVPVFSGYGVDAIASRLNAVEAKGLITCLNFPRRGKKVNSLETAIEALRKSPTIQQVFITVTDKTDFPAVDKFIENSKETFKLTSFADLESSATAEKLLKNKELGVLEATAADDPLIILYTSGTTGKPKGIAHVHCGFPIKSAQDMAFGTDVGRGTRISWVTDIGWMMGPWLIYGALLNGATMVLYDGSPDYPTPDRMWEFCAKHQVEILGISPTLVRTLATKGDDLPKKHDLTSLRAFASTGEPWNLTPWQWLFEVVGNKHLPIINYSGGTEISGGILMGNPLLPLKPCSFPAPCLGIDTGVLNENAEEVEAGKVGELVIRQPWIGMARGFWKEPQRYLDTYWNRFEDIWVHGDFAMKDSENHWYILGRSDDTLKVAGKRVGPAEVETLLVAHEKVSEAAVIGVPDEIKGTKMVAFCVLNKEVADTEEMVSELKKLVAQDMGKPLQPSLIYFVKGLPKTRNAKVMRRVIRAAYLNEDAGDLSALENPQTVEEIAKTGKS